jgi:hypothetical protein
VTSADAALFVTVWLAVTCFVAGQAGQRIAVTTGRTPAWAWPVWSAGALVCVVHALLAFGVRYGWTHERAVSATAEQTAAVYGIRWGGGVYVNYVFLAVWLAEAAWWRTNAAGYLSRPMLVTSVLRAFYLIVFVNAAVVFAAPSRRVAGVILSSVLLWIWRPVRVQSRRVQL